MKITGFKTFLVDAHRANYIFVKLQTDSGIEGLGESTVEWNEKAVVAALEELGEFLIGRDPFATDYLISLMHRDSYWRTGVVLRSALSGMEAALLDIKGKALGVPVYELFGGPVRERIPVYWSHCGSYRVRNHELVGVPPLRNYDDIAALGAEVKRRGFKALKTNILPFEGGKLTNFGPGFGRSPGWPELNVDRKTLQAVRDLLGAFRAGAGPDMGLHLDVNYHFKTEGYLQIAKAVAPFDMTWLEIDTWDPQSLALIRRAAPCPIASLESVCGRRAFRPFFDAYSTDVAIIDVIWNGFLESIKIASMAEAYEVNCAPHNYYGHLCSAISAHFSAVVPNFRVMEIDIDSVSWRDELFIDAPVIENGELIIPKGPGWGVEVNEAAVRAHPPRMP
jgi:L-alanine-DL-glutamate epimerase-like enolase superfamily enzyme